MLTAKQSFCVCVCVCVCVQSGLTPLHVAAHYDNQKVALLLLNQGASPHAAAKVRANAPHCTDAPKTSLSLSLSFTHTLSHSRTPWLWMKAG